MIKKIIFYIEFESDREDTDTGVLTFEWDEKSSLMSFAFSELGKYMKDKYPDETCHVKDWEWVER